MLYYGSNEFLVCKKCECLVEIGDITPDGNCVDCEDKEI